MVSTGWYKDMLAVFFDRFEVKETSDYGATDALLNKSYGFTLGDLEQLIDNPTAHWPLPITCPKCKNSSSVGHLDWDTLVCTSCNAEVERNDWILKGFEK